MGLYPKSELMDITRKFSYKKSSGLDTLLPEETEVKNINHEFIYSIRIPSYMSDGQKSLF